MLCILIRIAHRGTQYTISQYEKKITLNYPKSAAMFFVVFFNRPRNEFETFLVNEPSVFEPLKFYLLYIKVGHVLKNTYSSVFFGPVFNKICRFVADVDICAWAKYWVINLYCQVSISISEENFSKMRLLSTV